MLKFTILDQVNPKKEVRLREKKILMKYMRDILVTKLKNNQVVVRSVESHFAKFTVL